MTLILKYTRHNPVLTKLILVSLVRFGHKHRINTKCWIMLRVTFKKGYSQADTTSKVESLFVAWFKRTLVLSNRSASLIKLERSTRVSDYSYSRAELLARCPIVLDGSRWTCHHDKYTVTICVPSQPRSKLDFLPPR